MPAWRRRPGGGRGRGTRSRGTGRPGGRGLEVRGVNGGFCRCEGREGQTFEGGGPPRVFFSFFFRLPRPRPPGPSSYPPSSTGIPIPTCHRRRVMGETRDAHRREGAGAADHPPKRRAALAALNASARGAAPLRRAAAMRRCDRGEAGGPPPPPRVVEAAGGALRDEGIGPARTPPRKLCCGSPKKKKKSLCSFHS